MMRGRGGYNAGNGRRGYGRPFRYGGRGRGGYQYEPNGARQVDAIILPDGEEVSLPIRSYNNPRGGRGAYGNRYMGQSKRGGHVRSTESGGNIEDAQVPIPKRPLTRVVARARGRNDSAGANGDGPAMRDAYRMEVNEYVKRSTDSDKSSGKPILCVTIRDMHTFIDEKKQRRVWIPVSICETLVQTFKKTAATKEEGQQTVQYDVNKLEEEVFVCPVTNKNVEIECVDKQIRLRTYMDAPSKEEFKEGDLIEVIELRNELVARLIKFLDDVATRYRHVTSDMTIPSLYSYSGERRFYYDLRETRWGLRLHISQVTDLHRNVIGIPLESVLEFRDRLNQVIDFLALESGNGDEEKRQRPRANSGYKRNKKTGRKKNNGGRRNKNVSRSEASGEETVANGDATEEKPTKEVTEKPTAVATNEE